MVMVVDMVDMVTAVDTMARGRLKPKLKLMLSQATFPEDMDMGDMVMEVMVAMGMDVATMARGRLMLNQDILEDMVVMATDMDMGAMDMVDMAIMVEFLLILFKNTNKQNSGLANIGGI